MRKLLLMLTAAVIIFATVSAQAETLDGYDYEVLAKAMIDECFFGIGDANNVFPFVGSYDACQAIGGHGKVNQAYVWGLTKEGDNLWFGTAPNTHCMVLGGYLDSTVPIQTGSYACEFGQSSMSPPLPGEIGDWRPPNIFVYNTKTKTLSYKNPAIIAGGDALKIQYNLGIRSAGSHDNVVFLAGPSLEPYGTITLFAFRNDTGAYLGSHILPYDNIRKWKVVNDHLYTAAGDKVLKWVGNESDPFQFVIVGNLAGGGAELEYHEGRVFVSTWPGGELAFGGGNAGLWMSPIVGDELTIADADNWQKVWDANDYDPDPVTAATYGGGALASFEGYLYWGTMHVPFLSTLAHTYAYGPGDPNDPLSEIENMLMSHRAISIFRGRNFATTPELQLLYGEENLGAYHPIYGWQLVPNNMGQKPLYGSSGINNFFNNYTWTMDVYDNRLFIGTMDWSYLAFGDIDSLGAMPIPASVDSNCISCSGAMKAITAALPMPQMGADLFYIKSSDCRAYPLSLDGVGNYSSYGIRTMVSDDALYLGMANPMNLLTDPYDDKPQGGWELIGLKKHVEQIKCDINGDGKVDLYDCNDLAGEWLKMALYCGGDPDPNLVPVIEYMDQTLWNPPVVPPAPPAPIIIDNGDTGTSGLGTWTASVATGYYDTDSLYSSSAGAKYTFQADVTGDRDIFLWWTSRSSRSSQVPVQVYDGSTLVKTVMVDQKANGGKWNYITTASFTGTAKIVVVGQYVSGTNVCADAVKISPVGTTIDNDRPGTTSVGNWQPSASSGYYGSNSLYCSDAGCSYTYEAAINGQSDVYVWWTERASRSAAVPIEIYDGATLIDTVTVNQKTNGGRFNYIGTYTFTGTAKVKIKGQFVAGTNVCADAVKFGY